MPRRLEQTFCFREQKKRKMAQIQAQTQCLSAIHRVWKSLGITTHLHGAPNDEFAARMTRRISDAADLNVSRGSE